MNKHWAAVLIVAMSMLGCIPTADAAGCVSGAAMGGAAGHFVGKGHALAGAAVGCAVGHHEAKKKAKAAARSNAIEQNRMERTSSPETNPPVESR